MLSILFYTLSLLATLVAASIQIVPGSTVTTAGTNQHMQAHGGGIVEVDNVFYQIGENKLNGSAFQSINCYSSTDLVQWTFVNELLTLQASGDLGPNRVVERPHVIYNDASSQYVMWMHIDNSSYGEARAGVATSSSICGDYTYLGASQPLGFQSRDLNVFKDTDGTAYLLTEDRANGLRIDLLSSDYLSVESATYLYAQDYEAPALYKDGSTYFMFASHESGWAPNDNIYCTATSLAGPWSAWADFATAGTNTFSSQTAAVVNINGVVMYQGDRWESANLMTSTYVWLPLTLSGTTATLHNEVNWILDISAGTWTTGPSETTPEAESSANSWAGGARILTCSACSNGSDIGYIGGPAPGGTLTFNGISSTVSTTTTIRIHHLNGDSTQRYANVVTNGVTKVVAFLPTTGGVPGTSILTVPLNSGTGNTIVFEAYDAGWAPDIDRLMVPVS
ncbi:carbohydrate-binding module family 35 protein [Hyaloscypha variabilis F]|uniref:Carbohydrate-binding module family 35 protein n=1 Tax=Hyaloscypha variabilis (strain UAMH 11265 / GT02V1 / F) TaxID=1149755 RepID=A0A2J6S478_HYAVF|nr:carbohydrate-binding module family 35 protein [Hyaloscypha variabilis F]